VKLYGKGSGSRKKNIVFKPAVFKIFELVLADFKKPGFRGVPPVLKALAVTI
jgi:hypothetical protein